MCYNTVILKPQHFIEKQMQRPFIAHYVYEPYFYNNGFNHGFLYIIPQEESKHIYPSNWGLVPRYKLRDPDGFYKIGKTNTLTARSEEIFEKKTYQPHVHERCLILADGFFEPHTYPDGSKQAYFCFIPDEKQEDGRKLFCMAGL